MLGERVGGLGFRLGVKGRCSEGSHARTQHKGDRHLTWSSGVCPQDLAHGPAPFRRLEAEESETREDGRGTGWWGPVSPGRRRDKSCLQPRHTCLELLGVRERKPCCVKLSVWGYSLGHLA